MTAEVALRFGMAAGIYLRKHDHSGEGRSTVIIAKDTRLSGYLLEASLIAGLVSIGIDVTLVGPMPTPTISKMVRSLRACFGIMITASHNPYHDNGFKIFNSNGEKLTEECEQEICRLIENNDFTDELATPNKLGRVTRLDDAPGRYIEHIKRALPRSVSLQGLRVVVDCANGASYRIGPAILWELGANVIAIHNEPDGLNINSSCGSMHPEALSAKVIETRADIGIALDGDADRVCICDENGDILDGDHVIAAIVVDLIQRQKMEKDSTLVVTDTSNRGLCEYAAKLGMKVLRTRVGDRNVAQAMKSNSSMVGGEKSGHIIVSEYGMVSDGMVAALHILSYVLNNQKRVSSINRLFELYPQYSNNVYYYGDNPLESESIRQEIEEFIKDHSDYRILVRKSGTERLIRVMVEGESITETIEIGEQIKSRLVQSIAVKL